MIDDRSQTRVAAATAGGVIEIHNTSARIRHLRHVTFVIIDVRGRECCRDASQRALFLREPVLRVVLIRDRSQSIGHLAAPIGRIVLECDRRRTVGISLARRFMDAVVVVRGCYATRVDFARQQIVGIVIEGGASRLSVGKIRRSSPLRQGHSVGIM